MRVITRVMKQRVVYCAPNGSDAAGQPLFQEPDEFKARWEEYQAEDMSTETSTKVSECTVYVEKDVEIGGMLYLGTKDDLSKPLIPHKTARRIKAFEKLPTRSAKQFLRIATV